MSPCVPSVPTPVPVVVPSTEPTSLQLQHSPMEQESMHKLHTLADCAASLQQDSLADVVCEAAVEMALTPGQIERAPGQASFGSKHSSAFVDLKRMGRADSVSTPTKMEL